jgi:hypothetical protein
MEFRTYIALPMKKYAISATILLLPESAWAAPVMGYRILMDMAG